MLLRAVDAVQDVLKKHKLGYTLLIALIVVVGSGFLIEAFEHGNPESNIDSNPDGLWWAVGTVTTAAYGDRFPVTAMGRAIAATVMILGIGLFGLLAASMASFLIEKDREKDIDPQIADINERLERMEQLLQSFSRLRLLLRNAVAGHLIWVTDPRPLARRHRRTRCLPSSQRRACWSPSSCSGCLHRRLCASCSTS